MNNRHNTAQHRRITEIIKRRIIKGTYTADEKMPSENDLVKEFKVSKHTLLKALNALINQGFIIRRQGSGTFVAPSLSARKNKKIAVIVYHSDNPYYSKIIRGIENYASEKDYGIILCNSRGSAEKENEYIRRFADEVDGFIISPAEVNSEYSVGIKNIFESEVPLVLVSNTIINQLTAQTNYVIPDDCTGGFFAGKHLAECGYKKITMLICKENIEKETVRERLKGFKLALLQFGISFDNSMILEVSNEDPDNGYMLDGYKAAPEIARLSKDEPCGIFAIGDSMAIGLLKGLRELGINVPGQIGICGFDDIELASQWGVELTTIAQDTISIGEKSAEIITEILAHPAENIPQQHIIVPVGLKARKTTGNLKNIFK
ncbi:MAG: hypothetical protein A2017_13125 [Lentisphaerae bacterium GWF2_44_16]|nr:MAG: hypothetical protein A2017_13125 [Lentisphaerae bacterium GWF2_44_16]